MHLPSRSFSGVSAVYQSEGGPVPFTVMAATWKLYWLPFSSPGKETNKQNKWNRKERRWKPNNLWLYPTQRPPLRLPAWLGIALQGAGEKKRDFDQKINASCTGPWLGRALIPTHWAPGYKMNKVQLVGNWRIVLHSEATNCTFRKKQLSLLSKRTKLQLTLSLRIKYAG